MNTLSFASRCLLTQTTQRLGFLLLFALLGVGASPAKATGAWYGVCIIHAQEPNMPPKVDEALERLAWGPYATFQDCQKDQGPNCQARVASWELVIDELEGMAGSTVVASWTCTQADGREPALGPALSLDTLIRTARENMGKLNFAQKLQIACVLMSLGLAIGAVGFLATPVGAAAISPAAAAAACVTLTAILISAGILPLPSVPSSPTAQMRSAPASFEPDLGAEAQAFMAALSDEELTKLADEPFVCANSAP